MSQFHRKSALVSMVAVSALVALPLVGGSAAASGHSDGSNHQGSNHPGRSLELTFRGEATLAAGLSFQGTTVGGLSSMVYDEDREVFYAISDDQGAFGAVRVYTLAIDVSDGSLQAGDVVVQDVTALTPPAGETYAPGTVDPEGLALTDDDTWVVTSEGVANSGVQPWIREYRLDGSYLRDLTVPDQFLVAPGKGVRQNLGFESAAVGDGPFLFTGNEAALAQDGPIATPTNGSVARILRVRLRTGEADRSYAYPVDPVAAMPVPPTAFSVNGLVELLPLSNRSLLAMERSFSVGVGNAVSLHRVDLRGADDISGVTSLTGASVAPVAKTELFDLTTLGLSLDNLEGMTFGPRLGHGRRSLLIVSDNNFTAGQVSQFLMFSVA